MCGLAGLINIKGERTRLMLTLGLAAGIDTRGKDASGYISISKDGLRYARKCGKWINSRMRFIEGAAKGDLLMMHARYATCGKNEATSAHPFAIRRDNKVVLWGAHNGMIPNAYDSAKENKREIDVDSQEIFELLADKDYEGIQKLRGYGVITWVEADDPTNVKLARLSAQSDFCLVSVAEGGMAWASNWKILGEALEAANLTAKHQYDCKEVGRVYVIAGDGVTHNSQTGVKVNGHTSYTNYHAPATARDWHNADYEEMEDMYEKYKKEQEAKDKVPDTVRGKRVAD